MNFRTTSVNYSDEPYKWSGVLNIQKMCVLGTETSIESQMVKDECAIFQ